MRATFAVRDGLGRPHAGIAFLLQCQRCHAVGSADGSLPLESPLLVAIRQAELTWHRAEDRVRITGNDPSAVKLANEARRAVRRARDELRAAEKDGTAHWTHRGCGGELLKYGTGAK